MTRVCSIEGCGKKHSSLGLCWAHRDRLRRNGDPQAGRRMVGLAERHYQEVVLTYEGDECLIWPFNKFRNGYGRMNRCLVHRRLCEEVNGKAPTPKHDAAHSCGKGHLACVTKRHLSWKTHAENLADKVAHGTNPIGERNPMVKISDDEVLQIRDLKGAMLQREIADHYGVTRSLVSLIHSRKTRAWLEAA